MKELLIHLRVLGMFAQNAHNLAKGPLFFQDHCFLGEVYTAANSDYDGVAERMVGTMGPKHLNLHEISKAAFSAILKLPSNEVSQNSEFFSIILKLEKETCKKIEELCKSGISEGTRQFIGNIADMSEIRQYKIQQRLAK